MKAQMTKISRDFFNSREAVGRVTEVMKTGRTIEHVQFSLKGKNYEIAKDDYKQTIIDTGKILQEADTFIASFKL